MTVIPLFNRSQIFFWNSKQKVWLVHCRCGLLSRQMESWRPRKKFKMKKIEEKRIFGHQKKIPGVIGGTQIWRLGRILHLSFRNERWWRLVRSFWWTRMAKLGKVRKFSSFNFSIFKKKSKKLSQNLLDWKRRFSNMRRYEIVRFFVTFPQAPAKNKQTKKKWVRK